MRINYYKDESLQENRIDIYYRYKDEEIQNLITFLESDQVVLAMQDNVTKRIFLQEIYYLEIVDRKCFVYLEKEVYQIETSLKVFLEKYQQAGFMQIGKSTIANINKIEKIVPDINMRMHLVMMNGETLILNRSYKKTFIEYLKEKRRNVDETH